MAKSKSLKTSDGRHVPMFHRTELAFVAPLIHSTNISYEHISECLAKGLLSTQLATSFELLKFLSRTVLAAQKTQRKYGVPASVLIAIAVNESAWEADDLCVGRRRLAAWQGCDCCYAPDIEMWFLTKGKHLSTSAKFRGAMPLVHDVKAYVHELCVLGLENGTWSYEGDLLDLIENFGLEQCDLAAILQPGEFSKRNYQAERDDRGVMQLKPFDLRQFLPKCDAA